MNIIVDLGLAMLTVLAVLAVFWVAMFVVLAIITGIAWLFNGGKLPNIKDDWF